MKLVFGFLLVLTATYLQASSAEAQTLYVLKSTRGVITFTTRKPSSDATYHVFKTRGPTFSRFWSLHLPWHPRPIKSDYDQLILDTAREMNIDPMLAKAVVHVESSFDPRATSPKGAMGLMQLMPGTAQRFGVGRPYLPAENVRGGVRYLKMLLERYNGNVRYALAGYNAGEGAVDRFNGIPPYAETQAYVRRVIEMRELYNCAESGRKDCKAS